MTSNERLCSRIQNGESGLLADLLLQNSGMIHNIARRYYFIAERNRGADMDDLTQAAALGLLLAVDAWDESRGAFLTIAAQYMRREVQTALCMRSAKQRIENAQEILLLSNPLSDDDLTLLDTIQDAAATDPQEVACTADLRRIVRREVDLLPEEMRDAVASFYFDGKPAGSVDNKARRHGVAKLRRNARLLSLMREYRSQEFRYSGARNFRITHTSAVEAAVMARETILRRARGLFAEPKAEQDRG